MERVDGRDGMNRDLARLRGANPTGYSRPEVGYQTLLPCHRLRPQGETEGRATFELRLDPPLARSLAVTAP